MALPIDFTVPTTSSPMGFSLKAGSSLLFVGANGSGKTRLAVYIENQLGLQAHRISAHRALTLNPAVPKISMSQAEKGLRSGYTASNGNDLGYRLGNRWQSNGAVFLLNDYDYLVQTLFAEQSIVALETHTKNRAGDMSRAQATNFEKLKVIWENLISHRTLVISGDDVTVLASGVQVPYKAGDMSDGERAVFYLVGQTLCAAKDSVLIFDEPELHIHRAIMSKLWDALEAARPDCAFILISHDLEFVATRTGQKYVLREYNHGDTWTIEEVPETGFSEEITTKILGSRKPILFVEGKSSSLDYAIYRNCYPEWTVIHRNSCEEVIHAVATMRGNAALTRITCSGIVDADDYSPSDIQYLDRLGIKVLPVSEVENLFLLPNIAKAIGEHEGYSGPDLDSRLQAMNAEILEQVQRPNNVETKVLQYCKRRIDRVLKKIDLSQATTVENIVSDYLRETGALNVEAIAQTRRAEITQCIENYDIPGLMALYDDKGLVAIVARHMKTTGKTAFESWIARVLGNQSVPTITSAFTAILPKITPQ